MAKIEEKSEKEVRPPVVVVLGHIDHGKSTLIDYIRKTNLTGLEAGGITQHIGAYEITHTSKDGRTKQITFLDTPGHGAFSGIRTRSTNIADMAILVVSAEDGVKPQTLEVIKYIKECSLPYLVAITKVDKPSANILRTKQNLAENEIFVEGYGGETPVVELSALTGKGVDELLDMITLMAELQNKTADRDALGSGVIIEARRDAKRGISAVGIIKDGTMRRGLFAAAKAGQAASPRHAAGQAGAVAPMRFLLDAEGNMVDELSFSSPIQIIGWDRLPTIGSEFKTFLKKEGALAFAAPTPEGVGVPTKPEAGVGKDVVVLPLVIKTDTAGSLEAITGELGKLSRERITPKIILSGVGVINENDIKSALAATEAIILGFNTKTDPQAALLAERLGVTVFTSSIIYEFTDKVKKLLAEREPRIEIEEIVGTAKVLRLFDTTKGKQVIGGRVLSGELRRGAPIKIIRRETEIGHGKIRELQQSKISTDSVGENTEFGAMIESKTEVVPGDAFRVMVIFSK